MDSCQPLILRKIKLNTFPGTLKEAFDRVQAKAAPLLRAGLAVYRQIEQGGLDYRAMSLVYTSLLALITSEVWLVQK